MLVAKEMAALLIAGVKVGLANSFGNTVTLLLSARANTPLFSFV